MILATKNGLMLWLTIVLPSIFPFLIVSELIQKTIVAIIFSQILSPIMKPIFKLPGVSSFALFLGMTGGYPIGAKITSDLRKDNSLSQVHAKRLISFSCFNDFSQLSITL
jgi:nucleoside recognition membrane protein YjiH